MALCLRGYPSPERRCGYLDLVELPGVVAPVGGCWDSEEALSCLWAQSIPGHNLMLIDILYIHTYLYLLYSCKILGFKVLPIQCLL